LARKRVVEVESSSGESSAIWWGLGGVAIGALAGILIAEKLSGRDMDRGSLIRRVKQLARLVGGQWEPLLDAAMGLRDAWVARRAGKVDESEFEAEEDDFDDDELDDEDGDDLDDELSDVLDEAIGDEEEESEIGLRVLEAFSNDPVLAERAVEIEADDSGHVVLHGDVRTSREVAHAVTIAGGVPGVTGVRQRLSVRIRR
jgi:hypothetical protein